MKVGPEPDGWTSTISQAKSGDRAAFDQIAYFFQDHLRRFIRRKISNEADCEDLCQEVLFRAYSKLSTFRGDSGFKTWLISIAKRSVAEYYRSGLSPVILRRVNIDTPPDIAERTLPTYHYSFERICDIRDQIRNCLITMMKTLTHEGQVALVLCDIYGFSDKASCRMMDKKLGAFKHLLHKSRHLMNLISDDTCAVVQKTGDFSHCHYCNALDRQMLLSKNSPLLVRVNYLAKLIP